MRESIVRSNVASAWRLWEKTVPGKAPCSRCWPECWRFEKGTRTVGHGVTLHYFAQHQAETLNPEHTILDSLSEISSQAETNFLRGIAGAFLFSGDDQKKPIKALSGGERNRVALARMLVEPANTLLLDEPTNHLDPASVDMLTDALTDFPGTIVFISHDPTFLTRISTRVIEIEEGKARSFSGDYEYYLWKKAQEVESIKETSDELKGTDRGKDCRADQGDGLASSGQTLSWRSPRFEQDTGPSGKAGCAG